MEITQYDVVYYRQSDGSYIKYIVKKKDGDELILVTKSGKLHNWVMTSDVLNQEQFEKQYNNEMIYE